MIRLEDIHYSDIELKKEYVQKYLNGKVAEALQILKNRQLENKAMTAFVINQMSQSLTVLQDLYFIGVEKYLTKETTAFLALINNFYDKQEYSADTTYYKNNFVTYNNQVYLYIYERPSSGVPPTDSEISDGYWVLIGLCGDVGGDGINVLMKYQWNNQANYNVLDLVYYNKAYYVAKKSNSGSTPSAQSSDWSLFLETKPAYIASNENESKLTNGMIWFETE